jgi:hypothetical protein
MAKQGNPHKPGVEKKKAAVAAVVFVPAGPETYRSREFRRR